MQKNILWVVLWGCISLSVPAQQTADYTADLHDFAVLADHWLTGCPYPCRSRISGFPPRSACAMKSECCWPFSGVACSSHPLAARTDSASAPVPDWQLVWADEFEKPFIDPANWSHQLGGHGWGNAELQCYTDSLANAYIDNGCLVIRAVRESRPVDGRRYTSARLTTAGKRSFAYGKMQARIKIPSGKGIWPAFWMMPEKADDYDGGWPACGEIDIMESINVATKIWGTLHFGSRTPSFVHNQAGGTFTLGPAGQPENFSDDFHIFSIVWEPGQIRWYCDDVLFSTKQASEWWTSYAKAPDAPFDKPFHFILNVAVGGNWPGFEVDDSLFPQKMVIDWVRVYQKS